jgi:hypothetical protein
MTPGDYVAVGGALEMLEVMAGSGAASNGQRPSPD